MIHFYEITFLFIKAKFVNMIIQKASHRFQDKMLFDNYYIILNRLYN